MNPVRFVVGAVIRRERVRSLIALAVGALVPLVVTMGLVVFHTVTASAEQKQAALLSADLTVNLPDPADQERVQAARRYVTAALSKRYGAQTVFADSIRAYGLPVTNGSHQAQFAAYNEFDPGEINPDAGFALLSGELATRAGEVTISPGMATALGVGIGGRISLAMSPARVTVVGIARSRVEHSAPVVLAGPGTWRADVAQGPAVAAIPAVLSTLSAIVPASGQARLAADFSSDQPPYAAAFENHEASIDASRSSRVSDARSFWERNTLPFTFPLLALMAAIVLGFCLLRLRRDAQFIGSLHALGFTSRSTTVAVALVTGVPIVVGTAVGTLIGIVATLPWRTQIAALADTDPSSAPVPWHVVRGALVAYVVILVVGIALMSAKSARRAELAAESIQFGERQLMLRSVRPLLYLGVGLLAAAAIWWVTKPSAGESGLVRTALACAALTVLVPVLVLRLGRWIRPTRLSQWLAVRVGRSDLPRLVGVVAITAAGLGAPLGLLMVQSSYAASAEASYVPSLPPGQVIVLAQHRLTPAQIEAIDAAAGGPAVVRPQLRDSDGEMWASPNRNGQFGPRQSYQISVVDSRAEAGVVLGWELSPQDWAVLEGGSALWLIKSQPPRTDRISLATYAPKDMKPRVAGVVPVVVTSGTPNSFALHDGGVVVTSALVQKLGIASLPLRRIYPDAQSRIGEIQQAAALAGIPSSDVRVDPGPDVAPVPMSYKSALLIGLVFVALGIALLVGAANREHRRNNQTLLALGFPPRAISGTHISVNLVAVLLGCGIGVVAGFGITTAQLLTVDEQMPVVVPWGQVGLTVALLLAVGLAVILLSHRAPRRGYPGPAG